MKTFKILTIAASAIFMLAVFAQAQNQSPNQVQSISQVVIKGKVIADKDSSGLITALKIVARGKVYNVVLDDNGNFLGALMDRRRAAVVGWLTTADNQRWLTVARFSEQTD